MPTLNPLPFLARHGINTHRDELVSYLTIEGTELSPGARAVSRSRAFQRCRKEWCVAASAEFIRVTFGGAR